MNEIRIPSNVDQPDKLLAGLTARQLAILSVTGLLLYAGWSTTRTVVPTLAFLIVAIPIGATAAVLALGQRDGLSLDRLLLAAVRQRLQPRYRVAAPEGVRPAPDWLAQRVTRPPAQAGPVSAIAPAPLCLPARGVTDTGVIDLGSDGVAAVAVASTVNFALRTPQEQEALIASFARFLHSLTAPVQVLVRAHRVDLSTQITELRDTAGSLPHPALEAAAHEHADYLAHLSRTTDLLRRQVLVVLREPLHTATPANGVGGSPLAGVTARRRARRAAASVDEATRQAAEARLARRLAEAVDLLGPAGITLTPLDAGQATAVLAAACNPDTLLSPSADLAGADEVITGVVTTPTDPDEADDLDHDWADPCIDTDTDAATAAGVRDRRGSPQDDFDDDLHGSDPTVPKGRRSHR